MVAQAFQPVLLTEHRQECLCHQSAAVTDDPFLTLIVEALNLMHPRFAGASGLGYAADEPTAGSKWREQPVIMEFYHQFRRLWDKAVPVQLGLGHILIQDDPCNEPGPDLLFWQLGEQRQSDRRFGAVSLVFLSNPSRIDRDLQSLSWFRKKRGYPHAVCVVVGKGADIPAAGLPEVPGVTVVFFDTERWLVAVVSNPEDRA
jgi:hypothetical protein